MTRGRVRVIFVLVLALSITLVSSANGQCTYETSPLIMTAYPGDTVTFTAPATAQGTGDFSWYWVIKDPNGWEAASGYGLPGSGAFPFTIPTYNTQDYYTADVLITVNGVGTSACIKTSCGRADVINLPVCPGYPGPSTWDEVICDEQPARQYTYPVNTQYYTLNWLVDGTIDTGLHAATIDLDWTTGAGDYLASHGPHTIQVDVYRNGEFLKTCMGHVTLVSAPDAVMGATKSP